MEVWYEGGDVVIDKEFPSFENRRLGYLWFTIRRDRLVSGDVAVRIVGKPTFRTARAKADQIVLSERRCELWRQVEELKAKAALENDQEKAIRLAERLGDLMTRLAVLGTPPDKAEEKS